MLFKHEVLVGGKALTDLADRLRTAIYTASNTMPSPDSKEDSEDTSGMLN